MRRLELYLSIAAAGFLIFSAFYVLNAVENFHNNLPSVSDELIDESVSFIVCSRLSHQEQQQLCQPAD